MRDLFDDFMDELRRREAEARGEDPDTVAPRRRRPQGQRSDPPDDDGGDDSDRDGDDEPPTPLRRTARGGPNDGGGTRDRLQRAGRSVLIVLAGLIVMALGAGGLATMWEAVFADVGVALLAILNAVRIQQMDFK